MAEAIGIAILGSTLGTTAVVGTVTAGAIVGSVVLTGAAIGAQYLLAANQKAPRPEAIQATLNQSMAARRRIYGIALVGGIRNFWESRNGDLTQSILLCADRIDGIQGYFIGSKQMTTSAGEGGGYVLDYPMINKVFFEPHLGYASQAASPILLERYPDVWTADHRCDGISYVVSVFLAVGERDRNTVYPQGANTVLRFLVRGAQVYNLNSAQNPYDPGVWTWSDNAADCILDYLRHRDGMRRPLAQVDLASFEDFAGICAETVPRRGGTEARYRLWGVYEFSEEPATVLTRMCATCDATLYQGPSGKIGIRGGKWVAPLVNIPTDIITKAALTQGNDRLDAYNRLKVSFTEPNAFFQPTEIEALDNLASQAKIGVIDQTLDLQMVPTPSQAARLAKIRMAKDNPLWKGSLSTHLPALDALGEQTVTLTYDPLPVDGEEPFMATAAELSGFTLRGDASGCDLSFVSVSAAAYAWDPDSEQPPDPAVPTPIPSEQTINAPLNLAVAIERPSVSGDVSGVQIRLSWDAPDRADVLPEAQYAVAGTGDWQVMVRSAADMRSAVTQLLSDGTSYDLRVRFAIGMIASDWSTEGPVQAVADPVVTGPPTGLVANGDVGKVMLAWTAPNAVNLRSCRLYRAEAGAPFSSATIVATINLAPNQAFDMVDDGLAADDYDYWVRALNRGGLGDASSTAGPVTATVT